jgi:DNA-binding NarL/FixJ family response regulator
MDPTEVGAAQGISLGASLAFVIADDHPMVRDALASALRSAFAAAAVSFAGTYAETQAALAAAPEADLLILDLDMPGMQGLAGLAALRSAHPTVPVAIVSATTNPAAMRQAIEMGAAGFIPKLAPSERFLEVIRAILSGVVWLPPEASDRALAANDREIAVRAAHLTPQQHRVLALMAEGKANKVIAYELQITEPTVKAHVTEILRKFGASSRTQAVIAAQRLALEPSARTAPVPAEE